MMATELQAQCCQDQSSPAEFHSSASDSDSQSTPSGELAEVTITGAETQRRLQDTAKPLTILDRSEIEAINPPTIFDVLETVPGLSVARSGGLEGQISLRGFNSNYYHSPLFFDGDRFKGRNTLEYLLLEPEDIQQVEVIRGPAAEAYGSEAVGGVVLIRSARSDPLTGPLRLTNGSESLGFASVNDEVQVHADIAGGGHGFGARLSVSGRDAGDYDTPKGVARNSAYKTGNVAADVTYQLGASQELEVSAREITVSAERAGGLGGAPGYPYVRLRDELQAQMGRLAYIGDFTQGLVRHVSADLFVDNFNGVIPSTNTATPGQTVNSTSYVVGPLLIGGNLLGVIPWGEGSSTLGVDFFDERRPDGSQSASSVITDGAGGATSESVKPRTQTTPGDTQLNVGVFSDNRWSPSSAFTVTAGARFDYFDTQAGTSPVLVQVLQPLYAQNTDRANVAATASLGLQYQLSPSLAVVGDFGNVFRMPSDTELFSTSLQGAGYALPNPALRPEHGESVEGGLRSHSGVLTASLTVYYSRYRDFVETVPITYMGTQSTQPQNVQRVALEGTEGDVNVALGGGLVAYGSFSYTHATDLGSGEPLAYIAPLNGLAGLRLRSSEHLAVHAEVEWAIAKTRIDPAQEYPTNGYTVANAGGELSLKPYAPALGNTQIILTINNIFNAAYRAGATYANVAYPESMTNPLIEPGRNVHLMLRHQF